MTFLAALIFLIGFFEVALSIAVLKAAPDRYDNRVFAGMGLLEGPLQIFRAVLLVDGLGLLSFPSVKADILVEIVIGYLSMGFAYSFPFNRRPPAPYLVAAGLFALTFLALAIHPTTWQWTIDNVTFFYFLPIFVVTLVLYYRNFRRMTRRDPLGIPLIMGVVIFRWAFAVFTFAIGQGFGDDAFEALVDINATGAVLAGEILTGYAVLKSQLFRLRGIVANFALWSFLGLALLALVAFSVDFVHRYAAGPDPSRALLILVAVIPVALLGVGIWLRPVLYRAVICPLDPRRALRRSVLERVLEKTARQVDPAQVLEAIRAGIGEVGDGAAVRFLRGPGHPSRDPPEIGAALGSHLAAMDASHWHRGGTEILPAAVAADLEKLPGDMLVPVRRDRALFGVLSIEGGEVDRDTLLTAVVLADHLALKIENFGLFAERLRAHQDLADTEAFLENLFDSLPVGVTVLTLDGRVLEWNRAQAAWTGVPRDHALGKRFFVDLFPGLLETGVDEMIRELCEKDFQRVERHDVELAMPGKEPCFCDVVAAPFRDRDGTVAGVVVINSDVTQRRKLETELAETRRLASLGSFAAAIAHDIRTPLTSIQMNVQILQGKVDLGPDDMEYFDITLDELRRLNTHVSEILDYAKPLQLHAIPTDLREIADDTARGLVTVLEARKVTLEREHEESLPPVSVDAQRIRQVLVNLVDNAANASVEGGAITLRTRRSGDGRVALEVADRGKGIRAEDLPRIFEPFFTTRADGTGLGLAIAHKIVRAHGAEILVESEPGSGARFTIVFPAARAA